MKAILITIVLTHFVSLHTLAQNQVTIKPGESVTVRAGDEIEVRCEGRGREPSQLTVCDCFFNNDKHGEAVGDNSVAECKKIYVHASPRNCKRVSGPVKCDCYYINTKHGEVAGSSGLTEQCKQIYAS